MAWNQQGGGGPWGQGPRQTGPQPPNLEELLRRGQDRFRGSIPGRGNRRILLLILLVLVGFWFASGFYRVQSDEQGVVLRFGEVVRTSAPGLHYHLPGADRERRQAEGHAHQPRRCRLSRHRRARPARHDGARSARGKPDADGRREHRRHRLHGVLDHPGRPAVPVQHRRPGAQHQSGGGERDARGDRQDADPARAVGRTGAGRAGDARPRADDPRRLPAPASTLPRSSCRRSIRPGP